MGTKIEERNMLGAIEWATMSQHHTHCALSRGRSLNCDCHVLAAKKALPVATKLLTAAKNLCAAVNPDSLRSLRDAVAEAEKE